MMEFEKINEMELENAAGGNDSGTDWYHDLNNFVQRRVHGVVHYDSSSCLTLRREPNGSIIYGYGWQNGDTILVHKSFNENGWLFAYKNGKYGYVNGNYVG